MRYRADELYTFFARVPLSERGNKISIQNFARVIFEILAPQMKLDITGGKSRGLHSQAAAEDL